MVNQLLKDFINLKKLNARIKKYLMLKKDTKRKFFLHNNDGSTTIEIGHMR